MAFKPRISGGQKNIVTSATMEYPPSLRDAAMQVDLGLSPRSGWQRKAWGEAQRTPGIGKAKD